MRTIWKYPLPKPGKTLTHEIPRTWSIVHVGLQNGDAMLWADIVDTDGPLLLRKFLCFGTGFNIPRDVSHVGTVIDDGGFVWHFYLEPL
ncbi:MAG: hypothetical protein E5W82_10215 [Mesorhizobium sp.]|nr:MAG: hypothetical protein E5W82_10215 [Mesorhizobium sp.]